MVLGNARAAVVREAEEVLRFGEPLFRGQAVPLECFGMVLGHTLADGVPAAE